MPAKQQAKIVSDGIDISGRTRSDVSLSTTSAQSAALDAGTYDAWTSADCFIAVGTNPTVTTSNGYQLKTGVVIPLHLDQAEKVAGIVATGTATLSLHRVR